ncbi:MAG: hypothetical protein ACK5PC_12700 [Cyclobacteriaceae bacterium]|jgi:hypothetical protein
MEIPKNTTPANEENKRLTLDQFKKEKLDAGLGDYLTGGIYIHCTANECSDCLPDENYCHDKK